MWVKVGPGDGLDTGYRKGQLGVRRGVAPPGQLLRESDCDRAGASWPEPPNSELFAAHGWSDGLNWPSPAVSRVSERAGYSGGKEERVNRGPGGNGDRDRSGYEGGERK